MLSKMASRSTQLSWADHRSLAVRRIEEPSEVLPRIFLGGHPGRYETTGKRMGLGHPSRWLLENLGINLVVCCCASNRASRFVLENVDTCEITLFEEEDAFVAAAAAAGPRSVAKFNIAAQDEEYFDMHAHFPAASRVMRHWSEERGEGVLVHCQAGMSRSSAVLAAYLIARHNTLFPAPAATAHTGSDAGPDPVAAVPSPPGTGAEVGYEFEAAAEPAPTPPRLAAAVAAAEWAAEVIAFLESRRLCVDPNPGFRVQLAAWALETAGGQASAVAKVAAAPAPGGASSASREPEAPKE